MNVMNKYCKLCNTTKCISEFYPKYDMRYATPKFHTPCKECISKRNRLARRNNSELKIHFVNKSLLSRCGRRDVLSFSREWAAVTCGVCLSVKEREERKQI